jgi:hypothetical protein
MEANTGKLQRQGQKTARAKLRAVATPRFALLLPGTQPRRTGPPRRQGKCPRTPPTGHPGRDDDRCPLLPAQHPAHAAHRAQLLQPPRRQLRRCAKYFMTPVAIRAAIAILFICAAPDSTSATPISEHIRVTYLHVDPDEVERIEKASARKLMSIRAVILPEGENLKGNNFLFGWPVAAMSGDNIVIVSRRLIYHSAPRSRTSQFNHHPRDRFSGAFYLRSPDRGRTWGPMVDLESKFAAPNASGAGGMSVIGVSIQGDFLIPGRGVLRSTDGGATFDKYYPEAFAAVSQPNANLGPHMLRHPVFGMLMFNGAHDDVNGRAFVRQSDLGWTAWREVEWDTTALGTASASSVGEPAAVTWGPGHILLLSREANSKIGDHGYKWAMSQHLYRYSEGDTLSDITFETRASGIMGPGGHHWANDTADLIYNPVTKRIEALHSARYGGPPPDYESGAISTLNLYSIDPEDLLKGGTSWRFECTLLERNDHRGGKHLDGLHPGGSVVDEREGVQHIFIYAGGEGCTPAGLFQITRTLDTPALSTQLDRSIPEEWGSRDIGQPAIRGSAAYSGGTFRLRASGKDIWGPADEFRYVYQELQGDGQLTARLTHVDSTAPGGKAAVMIRDSLSPASAYAMTVFTPAKEGIAFQYRTAEGAESRGHLPIPQALPCWIRIERAGDLVQGFHSRDGKEWTTCGPSVPISIGNNVFVGLATTSSDTKAKTKALFDNISTSGQMGKLSGR